MSTTTRPQDGAGGTPDDTIKRESSGHPGEGATLDGAGTSPPMSADAAGASGTAASQASSAQVPRSPSASADASSENPQTTAPQVPSTLTNGTGIPKSAASPTSSAQTQQSPAHEPQPTQTPRTSQRQEQPEPPPRIDDLAWPRNTEQLRDAHVAPDDFTPVTGPVTRQGTDLRDPRVAQAFALGNQAADLLDERARLLEEARLDAWRAEQARLRREQARQAYERHAAPPAGGTPTSGAPAVASAPTQPFGGAQVAAASSSVPPMSSQTGGTPISGAPAVASAPSPATMPLQQGRSGVQMLLLVLGIGLITAAVLVFATIAYAMLGDLGRAACIGVVGVGALAGALALADRLRVTAEGLAWGGLAALTIDAFLIGMTGLIPPPPFGMDAGRQPGWPLVTGALVILLAGTAFVLRVVPVKSGRPLLALSCFGMFALPVGAFQIAWAFRDAPLAHNVALYLACALACVAATLEAAFMPRMTRNRAPDFEWVAALVAANGALALAAIVHLVSLGNETDPVVGLAAAVLDLACATGLLAVVRRRAIMVEVRPGEMRSVGVRPVAMAPAAPAPRVAQPATASWTARPSAAPSMPPILQHPVAPTAPPAMQPIMEERPLGAGWRIPAWAVIMITCLSLSYDIQLLMESSLGTDSPWPRTVGNLISVALFGSAALAACLLRRGWAWAERITAGTVSAFLLLIIATSGWAWSYDYGDYRLVCAWLAFLSLLGAMAAAWIMGAQLPPPPMTARPPRQTWPPQAMPAPVSAQSVSARSGPSPMPSSAPMSAVAQPMPAFAQQPMFAQSRIAQPVQPTPMSSSAQPGIWGMPPATAVPPDPHAEDRQGLAALRWVIGSAACLATIVLWSMSAGNPQRPPFPGEAPATLFGVATLLIGIMWMARRPALRSWSALGLGLAFTLVPSLLLAWSGVDGGSDEPIVLVRAIILMALAILTIVWGALRGLQAPLLFGSIVLSIHVITWVWPWLSVFTRDFWWVWLALGGVALVVAAARYEHSINSMRRVAVRFSQLR